MSSIRIRPKVREFTIQKEEELLDNYKKIIAARKYPFLTKISHQHLFVKFKNDQSHFWSPELSLEIIENYLKDDAYANQKEPTILKGYVSPSPSVWAMFIFTYTVLGLSILGFLVWGTSQMMLGQATNMLWYALMSLGLVVVVFIATQIGQRIAEDQTDLLMKFVNEGLDTK